MMTSLPAWVTILVALITTCGGTVCGWILRRVDAHESTITRDRLDQALADSTTIRDLQAKLERDFERLEESERERRAIRLDVLRVEMFAHTNSRTQHERQLEAGKEYLELGGNGLGHTRYDALRQDYLRREAGCDWTYR
ncbi:hypothetical protein [Bifidobacterium platyrrhinorum]|uniref:Uncharacterized protein n=1 Tax=Bifidobacterium platyrrhinorum TaxID=2661628 RepID=A0A6L9SYC1_9BIFI|nr:hypothetical protein [Bifidobacterium platyrrhinorum]NEG56121.1 hypothetical protein [Bifidobacterium platyrrhinorum]